MAKPNVTSFENSSILRKFTLFFVLISLLPLTVLYYLYTQSKDGVISLSRMDLNLTLIFVVLGVMFGFFKMREILRNIIDVTNASRESLLEVIGSDKMKELTGHDSDEIAVLARTFSEITSKLEENIRKLEVAKKTLHNVLSRVGQGISSMKNIDNFLDLIIETVTEALQGKVGVLMLIDPETDELYVKSVFGTPFSENAKISFSLKHPYFGSVISAKMPVIYPKISLDGSSDQDFGDLFSSPMICAPLSIHGKVLGVVAVSGRLTDESYREEEMNLLFNLATQTAVAIENDRLSDNAEQTYFETISALALAVDAKDRYSRGHLDRVSEYCIMIGEELGLDAKDLKTLRDGARLHDLGKIGVTDEILTKPGPLTDQEWVIMRKHPEIGESIISSIASLRYLCDLVRHHHEMLDGSGYPDKLKGDEIHFLVRILTVADIYDALTTTRPYRTAYSKEKAQEILCGMKEKVDQQIVAALMKSLNRGRR